MSKPVTTRGVTMKDVAQLAGVHTSSVSVVLNGSCSSAGVSSSARQRIVEAAQQLGYRRNGSAHTIRTGRFGNVGLLLTPKDYNSYLPHQLLFGLHDALKEVDSTLSIFRLPDDTLTDASKLPKILRENMCDGLLIDYIADYPQEMVDLIARHRIPAIWINSQQSEDCVYPDDFGASKQATEHLIAMGHRQIVFFDFANVAFHSGIHYSVDERWRGYESAMQEANLLPREFRGRHLPTEKRVEACAQFLLAEPRATAFVGYAIWDMTPLAFAVERLGLRVPDDLSIVSFGAQVENFGMTEAAMMLEPQQEIARCATELLLQKIDDPTRSFSPRPIPFRWHPGLSARPLASIPDAQA